MLGLAQTGACRKVISAPVNPVIGSPALLQLFEALAVDFADPRRGHVFGRVDFLDPQRRLVLVEVLALQQRMLIVGPDERLQRMDEVQPVVLEAIVRRDGTVDIQRVVRSLGFGLDENAIQALKQWRFKPGTKNGVAVDVSLNIEVNFNLR